MPSRTSSTGVWWIESDVWSLGVTQHSSASSCRLSKHCSGEFDDLDQTQKSGTKLRELRLSVSLRACEKLFYAKVPGEVTRRPSRPPIKDRRTASTNSLKLGYLHLEKLPRALAVPPVSASLPVQGNPLNTPRAHRGRAHCRLGAAQTCQGSHNPQTAGSLPPLPALLLQQTFLTTIPTRALLGTPRPLESPPRCNTVWLAVHKNLNTSRQRWITSRCFEANTRSSRTPIRRSVLPASSLFFGPAARAVPACAPKPPRHRPLHGEIRHLKKALLPPTEALRAVRDCCQRCLALPAALPTADRCNLVPAEPSSVSVLPQPMQTFNVMTNVGRPLLGHLAPHGPSIVGDRPALIALWLLYRIRLQRTPTRCRHCSSDCRPELRSPLSVDEAKGMGSAQGWLGD